MFLRFPQRKPIILSGLGGTICQGVSLPDSLRLPPTHDPPRAEASGISSTPRARLVLSGFGRSEGEFGTISATIARFADPHPCPVPDLWVCACSRADPRGEGNRAAMLVLAILPTLCPDLLTSVPLALMAVSTNQRVQLGMKKALVKSLTLFPVTKNCSSSAA